MTDATAHEKGTEEEHKEGEAPKAEPTSKKPEEMTDTEFRSAVMNSLTSIMDSHMKLCSKLNGFIDRWELARKAGKF